MEQNPKKDKTYPDDKEQSFQHLSYQNPPQLTHQIQSSASINSITQSQQQPWDCLAKKIQKLNITKQLLQKLKKHAIRQGQFSSKVYQFIKINFKPDQYKKIVMQYQKNIINRLLEPILAKAQIDISQLQIEQHQNLCQAIGQKNQQKIVEFMQNYLQQVESEIFTQSIHQLLALHKQPMEEEPAEQESQMRQKTQQSLMRDQQEQRKNQQMLLIQKINNETQNFKGFLAQKSIVISQNILQEIITKRFQYGAFSQQIDIYLKNNSQLKKKKTQQTKLIKAFDEFFRNFQFSAEAIQKLHSLEIDDDQIKQYKQFVKKGDQERLRQQISGYIPEQHQDKDKIADQIVNLMIKSKPVELIIKKNLVSTPTSQKSLQSPQKLAQTPTKQTFTRDQPENKIKKEAKNKNQQSNEFQIQVSYNKKSSKDQQARQKDKEDRKLYKQKQEKKEALKQPVAAPKKQNQPEKKGKITILTNSKANAQKNKNTNQNPNKPNPSQQLNRQKYKQKPQETSQNQKIGNSKQIKNPTSKPNSSIKIVKNTKAQHQKKNQLQKSSKNQGHDWEQKGQQRYRQPNRNDDNNDFPSLIQQKSPHESYDSTFGKNNNHSGGRNQYHPSNQQHGLNYNNQNFNNPYGQQLINQSYRMYQNHHFNGPNGQNMMHQGSNFHGQGFMHYQQGYMGDSMSNEFMNYQKSSNEIRYVLALYQRDVKVSMKSNFNTQYYKNNENKKNQKGNLSIYKIQYSDDLIMQIFRLQVNQSIQFYTLQIQGKSSFFGISYKEKPTIQIITKQKLLSNLISVHKPNKSINNKVYEGALTLYLMIILSQFNKKRQISKIWHSLNQFEKKYPINHGFQNGFICNEHFFKHFKITLSQQPSRLLLYSLLKYKNIRNQIQRIDSHFLRVFSQVTSFQQCHKKLPFIQNQAYSFQFQTKLVLNCMLQRIILKVSVPNHAFIQHYCNVLGFAQKFDQKLSLIKELNFHCYQKLQDIYPLVKDIINLNNCSISEFIILRLNLLSPPVQRIIHNRLEEQKRHWLVQIIKQISNHIQKCNETQIQQMNINLQKLNGQHHLLQDILLGRYNQHGQGQGGYQTFLFQHQLFYDYFSQIIKIFRNKKLKINQYFLKTIGQDRFPKAMQFVITKTEKFAHMISFMCGGSSTNKRRQQLENIIKRIDNFNKNNILDIITRWYGQDFTAENNQFFTQIFIKILKISKPECFTAYEFLKIVQMFMQDHQKSESVIIFTKMVLPNLKKLPQLADLKTHLAQIKNIDQITRSLYLQELSNRLQIQKPSLQKLQKVTSELIFDNLILKDDRQVVLKKLFLNRNDKSKQSLKGQIIQYLIQGKKQMRVLSYYRNFKKVLLELISQIQNKQIQYSIIENIRKQKVTIFTDDQKQEFMTLRNKVEDIGKQIQALKKKNDSLIKVLISYQDLFESQRAELTDWSKKLNNNQVKVSLKNTKKYTEFLDVSDQINSLMKIPLWESIRIKKMNDLLDMRRKTINQFDKLVEAFQQKNLNYSEFKKYFKIQIRAIILERLGNQQVQLKAQLSQFIEYLDQNTLKHCAVSIKSINQVCKIVQKQVFFQPKYLQTVQNLQNPQQNITIEQAYKRIKSVDSKFKQIDFQILDQDEQILKTLIFKQKYQRVFDMIYEKKIDSSTVLNDLKQYINDVENSIIKIQDIKQLQNVVLLCQILKKSNSFKGFLKDLRNEVKIKKLKLSDNIHNIDSKVKQFEQMIDSSANRQTSFKYDIQQIFKHSIVKIKNINGFAHVEIQLKEKQLITENQNNQQLQRSIFSFKKLTQFKDKAILLVSDFQRSAQNLSIMQQTIDLFKQYLGLYKVLQEIQSFLQKAIIYGYNPEDLKQQQIIKDHNFKFIEKMKDQIQNLSKEWIEGMKQMYEQSYLLTHFMGPKLNSFINDTLNFKFSPLIRQIVDIDQKQFAKYMDSLKFMGKDTTNMNPIDKVKQICKIFKKVEESTLKRFQKTSIIEQTQIKNKIQLITCHKVENYYFALVKGNRKPEMNQILYCQKETAFEEIQVFIKRAIIKNHRKHYFIGIHYLPTQVQLKFIDLLNEYLKTQQKRLRFSKCKLCFIDDSPIQKVYLHLCKKQLFDAKQTTDTHLKTKEQIENVLRNLEDSYLIESRIPGLGKTYKAQKIKQNSHPIHFSVAGHIDFSRLLQRLKTIKFIQDKANTFIIQVGHVQNKNKLEIFLFQMVFFKGFNFKQFFYLPKNTSVVVQIQNVYDTEEKYNYYSILKIIKENTKNYIFIDQFKLEELQTNFSKIDEAFTFSYLISIYNLGINKEQKSFKQFQELFKKNPNMKICSKQDARKLIDIYFCKQLRQNKTQPTFSLYKSFIRLLFTAFRTFSENGCFNIFILQSNHRANRHLALNNVRIDFLNCCIKNCIQFLQATINTNEFNEGGQNMNQIPQEEDFRQKLSKFPFLIMPSNDFQNYQFVYLNSQGVDISIKSLIISQTIYKYIKFNKHGYQKNVLERKLDQQIVKNLFSQNSLENLKQELLEREIYRMLHQLSGNKIFDIPDKITIKQFKGKRQDIKNYSITLDNFFKMCLIMQRAVSHIPIVIMGQSGVGKTALIRYLVKVVFQHQFLLFNIHAGIDQQKLVQYYNQIVQASDKIRNIHNQKVWVFFDQFNTTDQLSYIKQMIIDRRFQGNDIPENVVLIGACNPYRQRKQSNYKKAGIKKKLTEYDVKNQANLAFKVKPPSLSMIQFMWDYQQLQRKQNLHYISKILQSLQLSQHDKVVDTISYIHEDFKRTYEISAVSLRDVTRFKQLYSWFLQNMPLRADFEKNKIQNPNYNMNREQRAISLSIAFVYSLRIADRQQRKQLLRVITKQLEFQHDIQKVVQNQQTDYVQRLKISNQRIAINFSLRQNVFTTLVCIMNKIPILIIGNPGNSKSLSIRMISSNLRGHNSQSQFCQQFPELSIIYFQGSQACTSKGVQAVFQKAIKSNADFKKKKQKQPGLGDVQNCVLFDEIGLAQKSIHNPLKVLHSKLQTNRKQICFIGISNWQLDAAKMSRFLVLSRSNPEKQQLRDTAIKILQSYLGRDAYKHEKTFSQMSDWYCQFVKQWDQQNKDSYKQGFFGLRDFYCYIKYVAQDLLKTNVGNLDDVIRKSIQTNFDGQQGSVKMFLKIAGLEKIDDQYTIQTIKIVQQNLSKDSSRCLLLIVRGDALLPIVRDKISVKGIQQRIQCIYGSTFASDQQSQQYNLQMTSIIISHMSRGTILTFKNPNNSIQTSLYDVFNKSFTYSGPKKYCRVAVGANSNPKCVVSQSFGSIVFMDQQVIKNTDLAFLNRFQKHFLALSNVITKYQSQVVQQIQTWINQLLKFKSKTDYKKQQHYLINSSQQSIVTLVLKYSNVYKQTSIRKIKKLLLKNATQHFHIALKAENKNYIPPNLVQQVNQLLKQIYNQKNGKSAIMKEDQTFEDILQEQQIPQDKIIFTYDESIYSTNNYMFYNDKTFKIRISEVKSERELRKSLKDAFSSPKFSNIHILIDFQKEFQHVNFVAFLLTGIKGQFKSNKKIYVIIKLSQISLQNSGRDHINISYLLNFQQQFIDSLTLGKSFMEAIQSKSVKQLYIQRKMQQNFDNYYVQAQKRFNLRENDQNIPKGMSNKQMKDFQFGELMQMNQNQVFRKQTLNFIYENLSQAKIDLSIVLNNKEDRNICSNPQESFEKYLQNCVVNLICCFFERVYKNNMLFCFDVPKLFQFYKKFYQVKILEIVFQSSRQAYEIFLMKLLETYIKNKSIQIPQYKKSYNSNYLEIKGLCLLPMALTQLQYISSTNEDSLFKISSKILQLSVNVQSEVAQQCQILMQKCISILNQKSVFLKNISSKKNAFDFETFLNQNKNLQIFYFFDMISKVYSESINTQVLPLQKLVYLFVSIFKKLKIKQKVIFLSLSKQLWSNIFNIWSLWITHKDQNFHREMQAHYLQNQVINEQRNEPHQLPKLLTQLCRSTLVMQQQLLSLDMKTILMYKDIDKYLSFFRKTYFYTQKIRLTCMDLKVQTSQTMKATKRFFDLLDKLYEKHEIQQQLVTFLTTQLDSFQSKVQKYLSQVLQEKRNSKVHVQNILNYLSLDIYSSWIQRLKRQQQEGQNVSGQIRNCINTFIFYSDKYSSFANNSSFFLQSIFQYFIDDLGSIEQKLDYLENQHNEMIDQIKQNLLLQNNFAVALGNFFMNDIKACIEGQDQGNQGMAMQQKVKQSFLKKYEKQFNHLIKKNKYENKVFEVFALEFMKYYSIKYLQAVVKGEDQAMTFAVDNLLNQTNATAEHLRLFLLKKLLYQQQKMTKIKQKYLENKVCKWLQHFRQLVSGKTFQLLVPPAFQEQAAKILKLITAYREEQYQKQQIFQQMLKQSFVSPITKYQFLTFMMNDVYTRSCPEDRVQKINEIIKKSQFYKDGANIVQFNLLKCYINHAITNTMKYQKVQENESPQKRIEQFVSNQLTFINYLNIFVACNKCECPLIEMFFDLNGNVPSNYHEWLEQRFLVNGRQNQSVSILKRFIQLNDNTPGYYKCSAKCDMFYTIGGSGGFGCQLPRVQGRCGWCNGIIGGTNHILTRAHQGARKVDLTQLPFQLQQIREKKKLQILNHKLNGYSFSVNSKQMIQQVQANRRIPQSVKFILQQMIFSIWSFLSSTELVKKEQIKQIFQMNSSLFEQQSYQIIKEFFKLQSKTLNLNDEDQSNIIWHLGISKQIMKFILSYKSRLTQDQKQKMGLIKCIGRDTFEQYLSNNIILTFSSGNQKLALINRSRCVKAGVNLSGQQILRQTGGHHIHLQKYPKIRLIKLLFENKYPCFENLVKEYKQIINRDYKILGYYIQNEQQIQRLNKYRIIYTFCTKILKLFNMKVTRRQARTKGIIRLYNQLYENKIQMDRSTVSESEALNNFREQVMQFCQVWNQLRQMKFQLQYGCHTFGKMNQVTQKLGIQSPAINFFPDIKYKGDQKGQMLLSLLQVSSQQYNTVCSQINHLKMGCKRYRQLQILNTKPLNPTQIQPLTKTLQLNHELIEDNFIGNFSNWSVQYGCGLPHYCIDKVQSLMIEHIVGSHILSEQIKEYDTVNFIGEQLNFIAQLRNLGNQRQWQMLPKKQQIQKHIITLKHNEPDTFLKLITSLKGSLQLVLHYCRLQKGQQFDKYTILEFIELNKIKITSNQLIKQELLHNIQMRYILALYEYIELYTLKNSSQCLDESYKKQRLSQVQEKCFNQFLDELKKSYPAQEDVYYHLAVALYRFVARSLLLVQFNEAQILYYYLYEGSDLWPHKFDLQKLNGVKHFQDAFTISLTKIGALLQKIPLEIKRSKTQMLMIDKKKMNEQSYGSYSKPQVLKKEGAKKKKQNL